MTSKVPEIARDWYCAEGTILQVQLYQTPFWIYSSPSSNKHTWSSLSSPAGFRMSSGFPCLQNSSASALTITESQYRFGMPQQAKYKHTKNQTQRELLTTQKPLSLGSGGCRESWAGSKRLYPYWETPHPRPTQNWHSMKTSRGLLNKSLSLKPLSSTPAQFVKSGPESLGLHT